MSQPPVGQPAVGQPRPSSPAPAPGSEAAPVPQPDEVRPPASGRPRLPFSPNPSPAPQAGPVGTVRPGSGGLGVSPASGMGTGAVMGSGVRGASFGGGFGGPSSGLSDDDDVVIAPRGVNPSSGLAGLGRISREQGDNLARLSPTPTEQPTVPLRRRKPAGDAASSAGEGDGPSGEAGQGGHGAAGAAGSGGHAAPAPQAQRPAVAVEPWMPSYDDILPQRSARSGRSFRLRRR